MTGQEYRSIACYRHIGSNPMFVGGSSSLIITKLVEKVLTVKTFSYIRSFQHVFCVIFDIAAQPLMWLMLIAKAMGKYLMNEY